MCGIAGILNLSPTEMPDASLLQAMVTKIHHRGPDDSGFYIDNDIGLAHARLSIVDITGGRQPIHNESKDIQLVFNGEIFNFVELRNTLEAQGHVFYTHTDTEVIVHAYEEYGDDFVQYLNGQFAIALWDKRRHRLLLVRDRIGIHPLFYKRSEKRLVFASEIKAILPALEQRPNLNPVALDQLFTFWAPISPNTIFKDIYEVSPGEMIIVEKGELQKTIYWDFSFPTGKNFARGKESELAEQLHEILVDATKVRLRADVPVGAYLSGGLDSSVVTSIIHHFDDASLRTFSIGFSENEFDETSFQSQMIAYLKTEHSRIICSNQDISDNFIQTIWHTESPILRTAPVPMRILSGLVKEHGYKVVLTGEGADEVLGGYDIFKEGKIRQFWARNRDSKIRPLLLKRLYPYLDISKSTSKAYLEAFFGLGLSSPELPWFSHIPRWTTTAKCKDFFSDDLKSSLRSDAIQSLSNALPNDIEGWSSFNQAQYIEAKLLMGGYLLCSQGDRMLMSNSVEGRFPFLDHRLIEFANGLDPRLKMKVLNEKYLLKRSMEKYLPKEIVNRYKQPYRAPDIAGFFNGRFPDYVEELTSETAVNRCGYFDGKKVHRLKEKIRRGKAIGYKDNMAFVGILSTQVWHNLFVENSRY